MKQETYYRLSAKGRRRADIIRFVEVTIEMIAVIAAMFVVANGVGLLFRWMGV